MKTTKLHFNRRELAYELGIKSELLHGLNRYLTQGEDYEYGHNMLNGVMNQYFYTRQGKLKIVHRIAELNKIRKRLISISRQMTGNNHFKSHKETDVAVRLGMLKYLGDKLSIYEICYLLNKDRSTVYHNFNTLNNQYLTSKITQKLNEAYRECQINEVIGEHNGNKK